MSSVSLSLPEEVDILYNQYGQRKPMGLSAESTKKPHFFLYRTFAGDNDLLLILNTKRCAYQCHFCQLPAKSSRTWIPIEEIVEQVRYVFFELKHSLSVLDRVTLSNDGSVLDAKTFPEDALLTIAECINKLRRVRTLVLETRLEFVNQGTLMKIQERAPRVKINILTGFETQDEYIREEILYKREPINAFLSGLDEVAQSGSDLTAYILYKPAQTMTDEEAYDEAEKTFDFLKRECASRNISYSVRLNPMYLARGSKWAEIAMDSPRYKPPCLTDVMKLAEKKAREGVKVYIGMSTEGLDEVEGSYMSREDFSFTLVKAVALFNSGKITQFDWAAL